MTESFVVPERLREQMGVLTGWVRHVGTVLIILLGGMVVVVIGLAVALLGLKTAIDNQDRARTRDRCTITVIAEANADLFTALVELDENGDISPASSRALVSQAESLNHISDRCAPE
jgi:hypothetical protein